ncbi:hypothetical protein EX30DRAFT_371325 [Ascodesmis nigricans]|uniref:Uncharacterized protein n=1 Tax=Ascodesmis nigricans TaxID=341454 RepID=A0A4S2MY84_9PEZI|nr:hypothetical protein EX30DRAFT_371325 [Ascodesmis nigricans]
MPETGKMLVKPVAMTWKQHSGLSAEIRAKVSPPENRWTQWLGETPKVCVEKANEINSGTKKRLGCETPELSTLEVFYDDAPSSWLFCFCGSGMEGGFTEQRLIDDFGRLPVVMRQHIRHLMGFPIENRPPSATAWALPTADIILWGLDFDLMLHEAAHILDNKHKFSSAGSFRKALENDACLPSPYASQKINVTAEVWAETFTVRRYQVEIVEKGKNPESTIDLSCMSQQLDVIRNDTDDILAADHKPEYCVRKDIDGDGAECCDNPHLVEGKWNCDTINSNPSLEQLSSMEPFITFYDPVIENDGADDKRS